MFQTLSAQILNWLVHSAWQAGVLALVVLVVCGLARGRIQPRWRFALWLIVVARLVLPVAPAAPWSLFKLVAVPDVESHQERGHSTFSPTNRNVPFSEPAERQPAQPLAVEDERLARPVAMASPPTVERPGWLMPALALVWIVGVIVLAGRLVACGLVLRRRQRTWQELSGCELLALVKRCREELRLNRSVSVFAAPDDLGPATCGVVHPRIVLPRRLLTALTPDELRLVLLHELIHVQRHDVLIERVATLVAMVHWFHPVGWLARYFLRRERELACDAAVLDRAVTAASAEYGQVLIKTVESLITPAPVPGVVGMFRRGSHALLKRRIGLIAAHRRSTRLGLAGGAALLAGLALIGLTDAQTSEPAEKAQPANAPAADSLAPTENAKSVAIKVDDAAAAGDARLRHHPLTVSGRAVDDAGQPISGATIYLVATNNSPDAVLGQTTTDAGGRYEFQGARLPYYAPEKKDNYEDGTFQVFGKAAGRGFAWLGMRWLYIDPRFRDADGKPLLVPPFYGYFPDEPIEQELRFPAAHKIAGRLVDEAGRPIAGVKVQMTNCDYLDASGKETKKSFREFRDAVRQAVKLMPEQVQTVSNAEGRFELASIPAGIVCRLAMSHPDYGTWALSTATVADPPLEHNGDELTPAPLELTKKKTRTLALRVKSGDTGEPVANARVGAYLKIGTNNDWGTTDAEGKVLLKLPPAEFTLWAHPPKGADRLSAHEKFTVRATDDEQTVELSLPRACVLVFKATDAETGAGVEGVTFWYEDQQRPNKRWSVQSNDTTNDFPSTDAKGELRALVAPGERMYGVGFNPLPGNYRAAEGDALGHWLKLPAGETVTVEVQLRASAFPARQKANEGGAAKAAPAPASAPQETARAAADAPPTPPAAAPAREIVSRQVAPPAPPVTKTISGRALDESGRPIAGATIYLVNSNLADWDKLAGETTTDENGRYEFRDAQLVGRGVSVSSDGVNEPSEGRRSHQTVSFRLAGVAPGRAFSWRGEKFIYLDRNEAERAGLGRTIIATPDPHLRSFAPWEKIELDLTFAAPQPIAGRIVDEAGKPVAGVTVRLSACFHLDAQGKSAYDYEYFCPNPQPWKAPPAVAEQIYVKTDADGNFRLPSAPPEVVCDLSISHPDYARLTICASTAKNPSRTSRNGEPVLPLPVAVKLRSLRTINVTVVRADRREPVPEASVWCNEIASASGSGSYGGCGELDKDGRGKLKLPPGKYKLTAGLWREVFAHVEEQELTVAESPAEQSLTIMMQPDRTRAQ